MTNWQDEFRKSDEFAKLKKEADANGWHPRGIGNILTFSKSIEEFYVKARKYKHPKELKELKKLKEEDWKSALLKSDQYEELVKTAEKNGWNRQSVGCCLGMCKSEERFWSKAKKYQKPMPTEPKPKDWKDLLKETSEYRLLIEKAKANNWSNASVISILREAKTEEDFWQSSKKYESVKPAKKTSWKTPILESHEYSELVKLAIANGWSQQSVGATLHFSESEQQFAEKAKKFSLEKPAKSWRKQLADSDEYQSLENIALANGWTKQSVIRWRANSKNIEEFWIKAEKFHAPPLSTKKEAWRENVLKSKEIRAIKVQAVKNGWSTQSVLFTLNRSKDLDEWNKKKVKFAEPKPIQEPLKEGWRKDIRLSSQYAEIVKVAESNGWDRRSPSFLLVRIGTPEEFWSRCSKYHFINPDKLIGDFFTSWDGSFQAVNEFLDVLELPEFEWKGNKFPLGDFIDFVRITLVQLAKSTGKASYRKLAALFEDDTDYTRQFAEAVG